LAWNALLGRRSRDKLQPSCLVPVRRAGSMRLCSPAAVALRACRCVFLPRPPDLPTSALDPTSTPRPHRTNCCPDLKGAITKRTQIVIVDPQPMPAGQHRQLVDLHTRLHVPGPRCRIRLRRRACSHRGPPSVRQPRTTSPASFELQNTHSLLRCHRRLPRAHHTHP